MRVSLPDEIDVSELALPEQAYPLELQSLGDGGVRLGTLALGGAGLPQLGHFGSDLLEGVEFALEAAGVPLPAVVEFGLAEGGAVPAVLEFAEGGVDEAGVGLLFLLPFKFAQLLLRQVLVSELPGDVFLAAFRLGIFGADLRVAALPAAPELAHPSQVQLELPLAHPTINKLPIIRHHPHAAFKPPPPALPSRNKGRGLLREGVG